MADPDVTTKLCSKCGVAQSRTRFYRASAAADGLQRWCKTCAMAHQAATAYMARERRKKLAYRHRERNTALAAAGAVLLTPKTCSQCGIVTVDFARQLSRPDGLRGVCRTCHRSNNSAYRKSHLAKFRLLQAAWRKANLVRLRAMRQARHLANPGRDKVTRAVWQLCNLDRIKATNAAYRTANKEEIRRKAAAYQYSNRDKRAAYVAANHARIIASIQKWVRENPERLRANRHKRRAIKRSAEGSWSAADAFNIRKLQRDRCAICRVKLLGGGHLDHITALSKGGSNRPRNLQWLCQSCNLRKSDRDPIEFMQARGFLL